MIDILAIAWAIQFALAQPATCVLHFTWPTYSAEGPHSCDPDTWNPTRDVDSVFAFGARQSPVWIYTIVPALALARTAAESTDVLRTWWRAAKPGADMVLLRAKSGRGRDGALDSLAVLRSDFLIYFVRTSDTHGNRSCWAGVGAP